MIIFIATLFVCLAFIVVGIIIVLIIYGVFDRSIRHAPVTPFEIIQPMEMDTIFAQPSGQTGLAFGSIVSSSDKIIAVASKVSKSSDAPQNVYLYHSRKLTSLIARPLHLDGPIIGLTALGPHVLVSTQGNITVFGSQGLRTWNIRNTTNPTFPGIVSVDPRDTTKMVVGCEEHNQQVLYTYRRNPSGEWHIENRLETGAERLADVVVDEDRLVVATLNGGMSVFRNGVVCNFIQAKGQVNKVYLHDETLIVSRSDRGRLEMYPLVASVANNGFYLDLDALPFRDVQLERSTGQLVAVLTSGTVVLVPDIHNFDMISTQSCHGATASVWLSSHRFLVSQPLVHDGTGVVTHLRYPPYPTIL